LKKLSDEILFQYIDNELSETERLKVEESLQTSAELRKRVDELKNVIRIPKYIQPLEPSLYFAQRLLEHKIKSKRGFKLKKYVPVFAIVILTAALMLFYKYNLSDVDKIVKESESNLLSYYTKNLKPLFVNTRLDADDVFNFAFNRIVPLDREKNQYLSIGVNESGKEYFEIRNNLDIKTLHSKIDFVNKLNLDQKQKEEFDNILNSYTKNLESQVVLGEDNAIGVNENLWNLNRAIVANVLQYAENTSKTNLHQIISPVFNFVRNPKVDDLIQFAVNNKSNKYVLLTPDTIVSTPIEIDIEKFDNELEKLEKEKLIITKELEQKNQKQHDEEMKKLSKELERLKISIQLDTSAKVYKKYQRKSRPFRIEIDEEKFLIEIPEIEKIDIPNIDSIVMNIDIARNKIHAFNFKTPDKLKHPTKKFKFDIEVLGDSLKKLEMQIPTWLEWEIVRDSLKKFKMKIDGLDTLINKSLDIFDSRDWEKFGRQMDSLSKHFEFKFDGMNFDKEKFKEQMEKFKDEMEKLKYEYRYELKPKVKKQKPEEI